MPQDSNHAAPRSLEDEGANALSAWRHDLRTPFNQIIGYAEMIAEDAGEQTLSEPANALVSEAHASLEEMMEAFAAVSSEHTDHQRASVREAMAKPVERMQQSYLLLTRPTSAEPELADNLERIGKALKQLRDRLSSSTAPAASPLYARLEATIPSAEKLVPASAATLLIVDDQAENRDVLRQRLEREGFQVVLAESGAQALELLATQPIDLVLLDVLMPGMDGIEVLKRIKADDQLQRVPVIMVSALNEIERVVTCIESGAEDYLPKPFNPVLLRARIGVTLERKRLRDEEARQHEELNELFEELRKEREIAHDLLLNILPEKVAKELQQGHSAPMYFEDTTICFTDFVGFTLSTEQMAAELLVEELHTFFTAFDHVMGRYGLEKMKTIGDSYMFASGLPTRHPANPVNAILAALELLHITEQLAARADAPGWQLRIGLHTGPVIAGVVGIRKFAFDVWGDSVNVASRMESCCTANRINISERTYSRVKDFFACEPRGKIMTKDKRELEMYFVNGVQPALIADGTAAAFARRYQLYFSMAMPSFPAHLLGKKL